MIVECILRGALIVCVPVASVEVMCMFPCTLICTQCVFQIIGRVGGWGISGVRWGVGVM